ncbi:MAG: response regulator, partial [Proteobacteria bacterium]|nr:response regulator [Pseudomonadota bacterium]
GEWRRDGLGALAAKATRYLHSRSRSAAVAVHVWNEDTNTSALLGVEGERFSAVLQRHGDLARQGAVVATESPLFAQFGFPRALMQVAKAGALGGVVVWLGYPEQIAVTPLEQRIISELAEALADEMLYSAELAKLNASVSAPPKPAMLAQFSHDIRSPLSNVKAILSLLRLEELRGETAQLVAVALSNCRGVEAVVEDVIDLSRVQAGKLSRRQEHIKLEPLVSEVVDGFGVTARMRGLELITRFSDGPLAMTGDSNQLRRMITNLVSNALKYTKFGAVTVILRRALNQSVEISVADTGVGMSEDQVARLFEPFTRFQGAEIEGVGLGLSIVKMLTEQHGGVIDVSSTPGQGSVFTLRFPLSAGSNEVVEVGVQSADQASSPRLAPSKRILVVDDDADLVQSLSKLLKRDGHEVVQAVTVHDALSIINFDTPELIITDASMPSGGGKRILSFVIESRRDIPVVFLSGDTSREQEFKALGAAAVLEKPCDFEQLRALLIEASPPKPRQALA